MPLIRLYAMVRQTRALGPFLRCALWVQGCPLRCHGCMTPSAQALDGGRLVCIESLAADILGVVDIEGITVSGGEPFAQAGALASLMNHLRASRDLGLILYSGYPLRELKRMARVDAGVANLLDEIDLLIDGPYRASRNDGAPLRGSSNQVIWPLSDRYLPDLNTYDSAEARKVELHVDIGECMLVGIPSVRQLAWWRNRSNCHERARQS